MLLKYRVLPHTHTHVSTNNRRLIHNKVTFGSPRNIALTFLCTFDFLGDNTLKREKCKSRKLEKDRSEKEKTERKHFILIVTITITIIEL